MINKQELQEALYNSNGVLIKQHSTAIIRQYSYPENLLRTFSYVKEFAITKDLLTSFYTCIQRILCDSLFHSYSDTDRLCMVECIQQQKPISEVSRLSNYPYHTLYSGIQKVLNQIATRFAIVLLEFPNYTIFDFGFPKEIVSTFQRNRLYTMMDISNYLQSGNQFFQLHGIGKQYDTLIHKNYRFMKTLNKTEICLDRR